MAMSHAPETRALSWSVSPPSGGRARLASSPVAQARASSSPSLAIIADISERLYAFVDERMQIRPFHSGSASAS